MNSTRKKMGEDGIMSKSNLKIGEEAWSTLETLLHGSLGE